MLKREFTAVYEKRGRCYVAWVEEVPGVNTQGRTLREAKENLKEALGMVLEFNHKKTDNLGHNIHREPLRIAIPA